MRSSDEARAVDAYRLPAIQAQTVTFVLTDVEGSTKAWLRSPEVMRGAIQRHDALVRAAIEKRRGHVLTDRGEGDSFFAVFAKPSDAVLAALDAQLSLESEPWPDATPIRMRAAVHTGIADDDYRGPDVNKTARLRSAAHGGQILLSSTTAQLVTEWLEAPLWLEDLGTHRLRDLRAPERIYQLRHPHLRADHPPPKSEESRAGNLPPKPGDLVGRRKEMGQLSSLLERERLVTLTGLGGGGKTRLALEVGESVAGRFADGVWFVDLAPVQDPTLVLAVMLRALGLEAKGSQAVLAAIQGHVADHRLLVILDNCEHLLEASAELAAELLHAGRDVKILATSREPLRVAGEVTFPLPPLDLDGAVRLFTERARQSVPDFTGTGSDERLLEVICRRLDGIPLAIELAAARVRVLSLEELETSLRSSFEVLRAASGAKPSRQQTLRATLDWSHDVLADQERRFFQRLAVFPREFSLESAGDVCAGAPIDPEDVLDHLATLVDRSLLVASRNAYGSTRYRLLIPVRAYALEQLQLSGGEDDVRLRHAEHLASRLRTIEPDIRGPRQLQLLAEVDEYRDDIRVALEWSLEHAPGTALGIAANAWYFWMMRDLQPEGIGWLERALSAASDGARRDRAMALTGFGTLQIFGRGAQGATALEAALVEWREQDDAEHEGMALNNLGRIYISSEPERARRLFEQALAAFERAGTDTSVPLNNLAAVSHVLGDLESARRYARATLESAENARAPRQIAMGHGQVALAALIGGDLSTAQSELAEAVPFAGQVGNLDLLAQLIGTAILLLLRLDRNRSAVLLAAAAEATSSAVGVANPFASHARAAEVQEAIAAARGSLTPDERTLAEIDGSGLDVQEMTEAALRLLVAD